MSWIKWMRRISRVSFLLFWIPFIAFWFLEDPFSATGEISFATLPLEHRLVITSGALLAALALGFLVLSTFLSVIVRPAALRSGLPAQARVLQIGDTGTEINEQPLVSLKLEVFPQGEAPFEAETEVIASHAVLAQLQPGAMVAVKYDPRSRQVTLST